LPEAKFQWLKEQPKSAEPLSPPLIGYFRLRKLKLSLKKLKGEGVSAG